MEKEDLFAFAVCSDDESARQVYQTAWARLAVYGGDRAGFRRFQKVTNVASAMPPADEVLDWIETVRPPVTKEERKDKTTRNQLTYEFEKLGEFAATLRDRLHGSI